VTVGAKRQLIKRVIDNREPVTIDALATETGLSLLTVYPVVAMLVDDDEVTRDGDELRRT